MDARRQPVPARRDRPVLAIDLGGTKASFAVIDANGAVEERRGG